MACDAKRVWETGMRSEVIWLHEQPQARNMPQATPATASHTWRPPAAACMGALVANRCEAGAVADVVFALRLARGAHMPR
jgi:hypothetical protein